MTAVDPDVTRIVVETEMEVAVNLATMLVDCSEGEADPTLMLARAVVAMDAELTALRARVGEVERLARVYKEALADAIYRSERPNDDPRRVGWTAALDGKEHP